MTMRTDERIRGGVLMREQTQNLTGAEQGELNDILSRLLLPTFTIREVEIATAVAPATLQIVQAEVSTLRTEQTRLREALERVNNRYYLADDDRDFVNAALSSTPTPEHTK